MRGTLYVGILAVVALSFLTSFKGGSDGAYALGYHAMSWAPPIILDVVALLAVLVHWRARDRSMRRLAAWFVIVPMCLSWGMQAIAHVAVAVRPAEIAPEHWTWAVATYAGIAAAGVAALLWFAQRYADLELRDMLDGADGADGAVPAVSTATTAPGVLTAPPAPSPERREGVAPVPDIGTPDAAEPELSLEQAVAQGMSRRQIVETFGISDYAARKARNGSAA